MQTDASFTKLAVELCYILIIFTKFELFVAKQSTCLSFKHGDHWEVGNWWKETNI